MFRACCRKAPRAEIDLSAISVPPVFGWLAAAGGISEAEMLRTFNCGIGMVLVVGAQEVAAVSESLRAAGEAPVALGRIVAAQGERVRFIGRLAL